MKQRGSGERWWGVKDTRGLDGRWRCKEIRLHNWFTWSFPVYWFIVYSPHLFLNFYRACIAQYAETGLISIIRFVEIRTVLVLRLSFAVSKTDEILSLGAGDHYLYSFLIWFIVVSEHTTCQSNPPCIRSTLITSGWSFKHCMSWSSTPRSWIMMNPTSPCYPEDFFMLYGHLFATFLTALACTCFTQ